MNNKSLYIIIGILILVIFSFFFLTNKSKQEKAQMPAQTQTEDQGEQQAQSDKTMVDCGEMKDPSCFLNRMSTCSPVKTKLIGNDGSSIEIAILGVEDEKCHFQRKINGAVNLNCYFPKGTLNWDTIDQTFGNERGLQKVVDEACHQAGW